MSEGDVGLKAFREYDFDADPLWIEHLKRVEIPTGNPQALLKVKAKWWKREKDPGFDVSLVVPVAAAQQQPPQQQPPQQQPPQQQHQPQQRPQQAQPAFAGGGLATRQFVADLGIIILSALYVVPLIPRLSHRAYKPAVFLCALTHLAQLARQFGVPPLSLDGLKQWAIRALPSADFSYAITALMFLSGPPVTALLPPYVVLALYRAAGHAATHHSGHPLWASRGAGLHRYLLANRQQAMHLVAQLEITLGFYMVFMAFTPSRSLILTYFTWQQLRQRYWGAETGPYHRAVWAGLDQATAGVRAYAPALDKPIGFLRGWFQSAHPMARGR